MSERLGQTAKREQWDRVFTEAPDRFGTEASTSAKIAAESFERLCAPNLCVLDLGSGAGRDALFFARFGMRVTALDFSHVALAALRQGARTPGLSERIQAVQHDVREPLPFPDSTFDACYSHMLYCMDFTLDELSRLAAEVRRVLRPGGIQVYTARTTEDPDFGVGAHRGEQRYEDEGFVVHFFDRGMVERLAAGFRILDVRVFEEGSLPRRLFAVIQEKVPIQHRDS